MSKNLRIRNPSNTEVTWFGTDSYSLIRDFCTCPGCQAVWTHMETGQFKADREWARAQYSGETQCMECGLVTEAIPKQTFRQSMRGEYRRTVDREPTPQDLDYEEER